MLFFSHHRATLALLSSLLVITACGKSESLPNDLSASLTSSMNVAQNNSSDGQFKAALPKILLGLEEIRQELHNVRFSGVAPASAVAAGPAATTPAIAPAQTTPAAQITTATPAAPSAPAAAPAAPAGPSAQDEFDLLISTIKTTPFLDAYVEKTEKNLDNGKLTSIKLNMFAKLPNVVKVEVLESSSGTTGAKILYTSGEGNKAKIRPGGAMSFITTELPKADDRLVSTNNYVIDNTDFFGAARRLSDGTYSAELVGKTTIEGKEIHVLKVTTSGTNSFDPRIGHEYFGYEPDTHKLRLWEIYSKADPKTPYVRMVLKKLDFPASLPDKTFSL